MTTQKRRVIYMTDEEWALLTAHAKEHRQTISATIRDMWQIASESPADPIDRSRVIAAATLTLGRNPYTAFRPAPKPGKGK